MKGITGENLMRTLERRLDNVIYRMGFGTSRAQARQIVRHGHIEVNGRKCNIPSVHGEGRRRDCGPRKQQEEPDHSGTPATPRRTRPAPNWMEVDRESLRVASPSLPKREDLVQIQLNEQLIVELYSK